jgi:superfamily II RNA helicase
MQYRGLDLDPFQAQAIAALEAGKGVLVAAPTGTGKTVVADWVVERALGRGREVIYTAPIKALSNQKFRDYTRLFGEDKVGLLTGDLVIRRDAPCRVMTTEILRNMLLQGETLPNLDAVVIDEIHFLDDRERGTTWEELLIYLPSSVQVVGLSATLANLKAFAAWLSHVRGQPIEVVKEEKRAVPLTFLVCNVDTGLIEPREYDRVARKHARDERPARRGKHMRGGYRRERDEARTSHQDIFEGLADNDLLPALYFAFSRKATENYARALGQRLRGSLLDADEFRRSASMLDTFARGDGGGALEPDLRELYAKGVAFHHAGLNVQLKALVEELYEARLVKMLYCTSTFALGINMPARTAAFDGLLKYDGRTTRPLTTREFMQKAGRAGRRGLDTHGHVVVRVDHREWEQLGPLLQGYLRGEPEPVRSSFSLSFNSVVNLLSRHERARIRDLVEKSFLQFHRRGEAARLDGDAASLRRQGGNVEKAASKLQRRAETLRSRTWEEFEARVRFLEKIGYLAPDGTFAAGARVLQHVVVEEIFVTEMVLSGLLEGIDDALLFGILCAVNKEFGRDVRVRARLRHGDVDVVRKLDRLVQSGAVKGAAELTGQDTTWCPEMVAFGKMWAEGRSLADLSMDVSSTTDISGDLVGAFRRAKDLCGQLVDVYADVPGRPESLKELIRRVSRDEVLVVD